MFFLRSALKVFYPWSGFEKKLTFFSLNIAIYISFLSCYLSQPTLSITLGIIIFWFCYLVYHLFPPALFCLFVIIIYDFHVFILVIAKQFFNKRDSFEILLEASFNIAIYPLNNSLLQWVFKYWQIQSMHHYCV